MTQTTTGPEGQQIQTPGDMGALVSGIAERLGGAASARAIFGDPIDRDGTTIVPVATVRFGYGGGRGMGKDKDQQQPGSGLGVGAGARIAPVGFLEIGPQGTKFRRIKQPSPLLRGALLLFGFWLLRRALIELQA